MEILVPEKKENLFNVPEIRHKAPEALGLFGSRFRVYERAEALQNRLNSHVHIDCDKAILVLDALNVHKPAEGHWTGPNKSAVFLLSAQKDIVAIGFPNASVVLVWNCCQPEASFSFEMDKKGTEVVEIFCDAQANTVGIKCPGSLGKKATNFFNLTPCMSWRMELADDGTLVYLEGVDFESLSILSGQKTTKLIDATAHTMPTCVLSEMLLKIDPYQYRRIAWEELDANPAEIARYYPVIDAFLEIARQHGLDPDLELELIGIIKQAERLCEPAPAPLLERWSEAFLLAKKPDKALHRIECLMKVATGDGLMVATEMRGRAHEQKGDAKEAEQIFTGLIKRIEKGDPLTYGIHMSLGRLLCADRPGKAIQHFRQAIECRPYEPAPYYELFELYLKGRNFRKAELILAALSEATKASSKYLAEAKRLEQLTGHVAERSFTDISDAIAAHTAGKLSSSKLDEQIALLANKSIPIIKPAHNLSFEFAALEELEQDALAQAIFLDERIFKGAEGVNFAAVVMLYCLPVELRLKAFFQQFLNSTAYIRHSPAYNSVLSDLRSLASEAEKSKEDQKSKDKKLRELNQFTKVWRKQDTDGLMLGALRALIDPKGSFAKSRLRQLYKEYFQKIDEKFERGLFGLNNRLKTVQRIRNMAAHGDHISPVELDALKNAMFAAPNSVMQVLTMRKPETRS